MQTTMIRSSTLGMEGETQVLDSRPTINPSPAEIGLSRSVSRMAFQSALFEVPAMTRHIHHPPATATMGCTQSKTSGMRLVSRGSRSGAFALKRFQKRQFL